MSKLKIIILMIALTISSGLYAEEPKGGFYGNIELGAGVSGGKPSGTDVTDDSKKIKKIFQKNRTTKQNYSLMPRFSSGICF